MPGKGLCLSERGDKARTRDKVQGELGPYQAHDASQTERGGKSPTSDDPKASSTEEGGRGGLGGLRGLFRGEVK